MTSDLEVTSFSTVWEKLKVEIFHQILEGGKNQNGGDRVDGSSSAAAADESEILCSRCFTPPARHQDHDASWEIVTASLTPLAARPLSPRRRFVTTHLDAGLRLTCVIMTAH